MRKFIRSIFQQFGYDLIKYRPPYIRGKIDTDELVKTFRWLQDFDFKTIMDVGANEGQFSDKIRALFPDTVIYAFEPLPGIANKLKGNFKNDNKFFVYNLGLGEEKGEMEMFENEYSPSSSFLHSAPSLTANFEDAAQTQRVTVSTDRLDDVFGEKHFELPLLVKIDVQGAEDKVIVGGINTLSKAQMIICELSFSELYLGQPLFSDLYEQFRELGFSFAGVIEQLRAPETNRILQADGIFIKH